MNKEVEEEGGYSFQNLPMPSVAWANSFFFSVCFYDLFCILMKVLKICSVWIHINNYFERIVEYLLTLSGKNTLFIFSGLDRYMRTYVRTSKMTIFQKYIFYYFGTGTVKIYILLMDVDLYFFTSNH